MVTNLNRVNPMAGVTVDEVADRHELAVLAELDRLRIQDEARRRWAAEKAGPAPDIEWGLLDEFKDCNEVSYRIEGLLPADGGMEVVAQRKTGKTTLMLNLARSLVTGDPFLGRFTTQAVVGRVALLNFEVSGRQVARWAHQTGIPGDRLFLVNLRGRRNPLTHKDDRDGLAATLRKHRVEVLIVDPFGRAYTGKNQNDAAEVGAWLADLDAFARSEVGAKEVILAVHAGWDGERTRGSSALEDWADSIVTMTFGKDRQSRYLRAIGRDVSVEEDQLLYDPTTRLLTLAGTGSRTVLERTIKAALLVDPVCRYVTDHPGASQKAIETAMREQRNAGDIPVAFQDADVRAAIVMSESRGLLHREHGGTGRATKHFPATPSKLTSSGQGQP